MLVTDRRRLAPDARTLDAEISALETQCAAAIDAQIDLLQIRERDLPARRLLELVRRFVEQARGASTRVLVNDRSDVAVAAGAAGVHLREDSPTVDAARLVVGAGHLVGKSVHDVAGLDRGGGAADYWLAGTMFASRSKAPGSATLGIEGMMAIVRAASAPVFAIGGIEPDRIAACRAAGAAGIAAIGAFVPAAGESIQQAVGRGAADFRAHFGVQ